MNISSSCVASFSLRRELRFTSSAVCRCSRRSGAALLPAGLAPLCTGVAACLPLLFVISVTSVVVSRAFIRAHVEDLRGIANRTPHGVSLGMRAERSIISRSRESGRIVCSVLGAWRLLLELRLLRLLAL